MLFTGSAGGYRLVKIRPFETKTGRMMHFVTVADLKTFESADFVLDTAFNNVDEIKEGVDYKLNLDVDGKYSKIQLLPLK